jgi:ribosomal protein L37AE/L43A
MFSNDNEDTERAQWALGEYTQDDCPNCGRQRLCKCPNGKTRCENCNWVVEDNDYCPFKLI